MEAILEDWSTAQKNFDRLRGDSEIPYLFAAQGKLRELIICRSQGMKIDTERILKIAFENQQAVIIGYLYGVLDERPPMIEGRGLQDLPREVLHYLVEKNPEVYNPLMRTSKGLNDVLGDKVLERNVRKELFRPKLFLASKMPEDGEEFPGIHEEDVVKFTHVDAMIDPRTGKEYEESFDNYYLFLSDEFNNIDISIEHGVRVVYLPTYPQWSEQGLFKYNHIFPNSIIDYQDIRHRDIEEEILEKSVEKRRITTRLFPKGQMKTWIEHTIKYDDDTYRLRHLHDWKISDINTISVRTFDPDDEKFGIIWLT
jgi:hypothetical protein